MKCRFILRVLMLLPVCFIFISSFPTVSRAQNVRVTLDLNDVKVGEVMDAIEIQTSYLFTVDEDVDLERRISIKADNVLLGNALDLMVKGTDLTWKLNEKTIVLARKPERQSRIVSGKVMDPSGLPVPGVSVLIRNTRIGTVTDLDGKFSLEVPGENLGGQLEFNSLGYSVVVLPIGQRSVFNVTLTESSMELEGTS